MGVSALATFVVVMLVVLDVGPFGGTTGFYVVAFLLVLLISATLFATASGLILEWRDEHHTYFKGGEKWVVWIAGGIAFLLLVGLAWLVRSQRIGGRQLIGLGMAVSLGAFIGVCVAFRVRSQTQVGRGLVGTGAAALGAVATVAVIVVVVVGSALYRNHKGTSVADPPTIRGITGSYVALGDSYSAGEGLRGEGWLHGTGSPSTNEGNDCHRSRDAYPKLLTFDPSLPSFAFRACSGAITIDTRISYHVPQGNATTVAVPPQVGPEDPAVGLVTITMGGNDVVFSEVVKHCLYHDGCLEDKFGPDTPNRHTIEYPGKQALENWAKEALAKLRPEIANLYSRLRLAYPKARIVVIGYPYLFPKGDAGFWRPPDACHSILRRFSRPERETLRGIQDQFNNLLYELAVNAPKGGIEFVSPAAEWDGHEPCGQTNQQYTNAIQPFDFGGTTSGGSFHPSEAGQKTLARLVACYLNANPAPPNPFLDGQRRPLTIEGLIPPEQLGLKPAPGVIGNPVPC